MRGFAAAWLTGMGIICYRSVKVQGGPPWPGQLLASSALFVALGLLSSAGQGAARVALALAWGLDAAAFLEVAGGTTAGGAVSTLPYITQTGWWQQATSRKIACNQILPSGGCPAADCSGGASSGSSGSSGGTSTNCPQGYIYVQGSGCVQEAAL